MTPVISLKGVGKRYKISSSRSSWIKDLLSPGKASSTHEFWAVEDVDLEIEAGTTLGVLGRNGAGKSTLLKMISGVSRPTAGEVRVDGRLAAIFSTGAGFNPEFTGRDNVMLNGLILGISRDEMLARMDDIEAFADIGEFMDQPVKTYSSGMRARLGFAVAVNVQPDILIVDETLSVGDAVFKHMGLQKMRELRDSGTTILFVSHSLGLVKSFCSEAVLLHKGRMISHGDTAEVIDRYNALVSSTEVQKSAGLLGSGEKINYDVDDEGEEYAAPTFKENPELKRRVSSLRHGTGEARVSNVEVLDETGARTESVKPDSTVTLRVHLEYAEDVPESLLNITLRNKGGLDVFSTSTGAEKTPLGSRAKGERVVVDFTLKVPLQHGAYSVTTAVSHVLNQRVHLDWLDVAAVFKVERPDDRAAFKGLFHIPTKVEVHSPDQDQRHKSA